MNDDREWDDGCFSENRPWPYVGERHRELGAAEAVSIVLIVLCIAAAVVGWWL